MTAPACLGDTLPKFWWRSWDKLLHEYLAHGTLQDAGFAHGVGDQCLSDWWRRHKAEGKPLPDLPRGTPPQKKAPVEVEDDADDWLLDALKQLGDDATVEQIADHAEVYPRRVREAADRLSAAGYRVELAADESTVRLSRAPTETRATYKATPELFDGDHVRFAVVSDVHLSSKAERPDALHTAYEIIAREGITVVYNPGDLVDGYGIYRTQNTEVLHHTYEDQVAHAVATYPKVEGVETFIIAGNHDLEGEFGKAGADPVQAVANQRDDITYLGRYSARVELPNGAVMEMLHPMGGASYALSYRPQKIVESYEGGEKPNILLIGHYHRAGDFPIRGVNVLLCGSFQGSTTYALRKAFGSPGFGFYLVDCRLADDGSVVRWRAEWMPFHLGRSV